ncbi:MAG: Nif3-like dinuclear metal center hexameric protein [Spirochaetia bacterium]|nr:Nif3-like dinuclear metal center hexameric protein [Spirochaetia bacterium]
MILRNKLENHLAEYLETNKFNDYSPNGIQLEGALNINKIAFAVSATRFAIEKTIEIKAQALIVHHGWFWKNDPPQITGILKNKVELLIKNNINLFAYHLPLDAHQKAGNNYPLLKELKAKNISSFSGIGCIGDLKKPLSHDDYFSWLDKRFYTKGVHIRPKGKDIVKKVAVVSGRAVEFFKDACSLGADAFVSGEGTEWVYSLALESGVCFSAMGHYKTEETGILLLKKHIEKIFSVECEFIEEENPF